MFQIHEHVDGATRRILEPRNENMAVFTNNFKYLMMTNIGRPVYCNVQELLSKV
jgi:hypothetical protein